jgi:F-type H+-transporting ATPase subunit epsilon
MNETISKFSLTIVSPEELVLQVEATKVLVPGIIQELAILPNHTPLYSDLIKGTVKVFLVNGKTKEVDIEGGILRVRQNQVSIILGFGSDIEKPAKPKAP